MKFIKLIKAEKIEDIEKPTLKYYQFPIVRYYTLTIDKDFINVDEELSKFKDIMSSTIFSFFEENKGNEIEAEYFIKVHFMRDNHITDYIAGTICIYSEFVPYDSEKTPKPSMEVYSEHKKFMDVTTNNMEQMAKKLNYALDVISENIKRRIEFRKRLSKH